MGEFPGSRPHYKFLILIHIKFNRMSNNREEDVDNESQNEQEVEENAGNAEAESGKPAISAGEISQEMKNDLLEFIDLCEQIKTTKDALKVFTERKSELEREIADFMIKNEIPGFAFPSGRISVYPSKVVKPLNKEYLRETLVEEIPDEQLIQRVTEKAFSKRPSTAVQKIRVLPKRNPRQKK